MRPTASDRPARLCGSYDHASSLGFNLTDTERVERLSAMRGGVSRWVRRGTAWRFEHPPDAGPATLVALAAQAIGMASPAAQAHWCEVIATLRTDRLAALVEEVPEMSEPTRRFAGTVLKTNAERMKDEFDRHG